MICMLLTSFLISSVVMASVTVVSAADSVPAGTSFPPEQAHAKIMSSAVINAVNLFILSPFPLTGLYHIVLTVSRKKLKTVKRSHKPA